MQNQPVSMEEELINVKTSPMLEGLGNIDQFLNLLSDKPPNEITSQEDEEGRAYFNGRWTQEEQLKYLNVVRMGLDKREQLEVMAQAIPTRSISQIRVHHQKMKKKYGGERGIISNDIRPTANMNRIKDRLSYVISVLEQTCQENHRLFMN